MNTSKRNTILSTIISVTLVTLSANYLSPTRRSESRIKKELEKYNQSLPSSFDEVTCLDSVTMPTFRILNYYITANVMKDEVDIESIKQNILPNILSNIKNSSSLKELRNKHFTWNYIFNDIDGIVFYEYIITPEMYLN